MLRANYGFSQCDLTHIEDVLLENLTALCSAGGSIHGTACPIRTGEPESEGMQASFPQAVSADYDRRIGRIVIHLKSELEVAFSPHNAQGLENARPADLDLIEISHSGFGIHFPKLDLDLYLPALLAGFLGSERWMASRLGSAGGRSRSAAKITAAKRNGRLGGRPRKKTTAALAEN